MSDKPDFTEAIEREPKQYRCEGCGQLFDEKIFSHTRAVDDGTGNPKPVQCGPIYSIAKDYEMVKEQLRLANIDQMQSEADLTALVEENAALKVANKELSGIAIELKEALGQVKTYDYDKLQAELDAARPLLKEREFILSMWPWIDYDPITLAYRAKAEGKEKDNGQVAG